ncbi:amidohydrolase family protein [Paraburkholderia fungorum]|uniref:amidohydrolase family protein n=1 Tax=Paraburkholderia fungorum TaxID=134537 RepID=UPI0038B8D068
MDFFRSDEPVSRTKRELPAGACDAHCHVFGPAMQFPYAAERSYTPADAPYETLAAMHRKLGFSRAVVVQGSCHGYDHSALLDALTRSGGAYRGVALLPADASDADVRALHEQGARGARFNFVPHLGGAPSPDAFDAVVARILPFGWHVCVHTDIASLKTWLPRLAVLPVPFVIDHMARIDAAKGVHDGDFQFLLEVLKLPDAWIKVSGIDRISQSGRPFADGVPCVRRLIEAAPERVLWGTDSPHPNVAGAVPDEADLIDALFEACPDERVRRAVLVDNPARLYGFE